MATKRRRAKVTSGTPTTTNAQRKTPMVTFTLPPDAIGELARLAAKYRVSRSSIVAEAILAFGKTRA